MYKDYQFLEVTHVAEKLVDQGCLVFQKWSCDHCGSRQTMPEPNCFYMKGICEECKKETDILKRGCNYAVIASGEAAFEYLKSIGGK